MEQMHALHTKLPRSRILELMHLGEEAKRMETNGAVFATRIRKWKAVGKFVIGYCALARKFGLLGFLSEEHDVWCGEICYQAALREAVLPVSYSQRRHFEKQYCTLVSDKENVEDWLDSMVSRVREHLEMLDEEHLEMLEMPEDDPPADRPVLQTVSATGVRMRIILRGKEPMMNGKVLGGGAAATAVAATESSGSATVSGA